MHLLLTEHILVFEFSVDKCIPLTSCVVEWKLLMIHYKSKLFRFDETHALNAIALKIIKRIIRPDVSPLLNDQHICMRYHTS
jgi:hypothetical protein